MPVVDTSCLIHLIKIGELSLLRRLFSKIIITAEVFKEMSEGVEGLSEIKESLGSWIFIQGPKDLQAISLLSKAESIELADASVILLALELKDILISNDAALIRAARIKGVECFWLTSCIIKAVKKKIITKKKAQEIMYLLISNGMYLNNKVYAEILEQIDKL